MKPFATLFVLVLSACVSAASGNPSFDGGCSATTPGCLPESDMHVMLQINSKATSQQTALPQVDRPKLKDKLQEMVAPDPIMVGGCPDGEELAYGDDCPAGLAELDKRGKTSIPYDP